MGDSAKVVPFEADADPIMEMSVSINLEVQDIKEECCAGEECSHEESIDPGDIVESNFAPNCPGVLAYGHINLYNGSTIAMTRNYGSSDGVLNQGKKCYPGQVSEGWYYSGKRRVLCTPTKTCSHRRSRC